jgi:hypothetical protein
MSVQSYSGVVRGFDEPKERKQVLPILRLRHGGAVCGLRDRRLGWHVCGERVPVSIDELNILGLFQGRGWGGQDDGRDAAVASFLYRFRRSGA